MGPKKKKKLPLRRNVCIMLMNKEHKLLLGERHGQPGIWQFPQGGAEKGFSLEENVLREIEEELGLTPDRVEILRKLRATNEYEWDDPPQHFQGRYRGQSQSFWLVKFLGEDHEINVETEHPEFSDWGWFSSVQIKSKAEPIRMPGYIMPLREYEDWLMLNDTGLLV